MSPNFYRAFEDRWRGSRGTIKDRLSVYLPFLDGLAEAGTSACLLDVGCGRGEWLELLAEKGYSAYGVDLDEMMIKGAGGGLDMRREDALQHLNALPDNSLSAVSAFHVVEHLSGADLESLLGEVMRVLKPGGLLLLETPNPENVHVGSATFYIDPTHLRPIPHQLLTFFLEYWGFCGINLLRLQHAPEIETQFGPGLSDVLFGVSPDYGVVAQKPGAFPREAGVKNNCGVGLHELAARFDTHWNERFQQLAQALATMTEAAQAASTKVAEQERQFQRLMELNRELAAFLLQFQAERAAVVAEVREARNQVASLLASTSWRLTGPLRWLAGCFRRNCRK